MRTLVTGGTGFIGTHVVDDLQQRGHDVTVLDVVAPDFDVPFIGASVLDAEALHSATRTMDAVVHLAGYVRAGMIAEPFEGATLQLQGTLNLLEACRSNDIGQFAFASSFYVYDGWSPDEIVDETTPLNPLAMELFGSAKLMGEALCREFAQHYGLEVIVYRFGPVYGGQGSSAIDEFLAAGMRGDAIEVWGSGERRNQYTFVADAARAVGAGLGLGGNATYNVIAPEAVTLRTLATMLDEDYGFQVDFDVHRVEGPSLPYISSARATTELAWHPLPVRDGIAFVMEQANQLVK